MKELLAFIAIILCVFESLLFLSRGLDLGNARNIQGYWKVLTIALVVVGTAVAFAGFVVEWMFWLGLIMIETGVLAVYCLIRMPTP